MDTTSEVNVSTNTPETMVTIPLYRYTELVCHAHDLSLIREIVGGCKDYIGSTETAMIKALCGAWKGEE